MVTLPADGPDEAEVLDLAARHGLALSGLTEHWHRPEPGRIKGLIIGYGAPPESGYRQALSVWRRCSRRRTADLARGQLRRPSG